MLLAVRADPANPPFFLAARGPRDQACSAASPFPSWCRTGWMAGETGSPGAVCPWARRNGGASYTGIILGVSLFIGGKRLAGVRLRWRHRPSGGLPAVVAHPVASGSRLERLDGPGAGRAAVARAVDSTNFDQFLRRSGHPDSPQATDWRADAFGGRGAPGLRVLSRLMPSSRRLR